MRSSCILLAFLITAAASGQPPPTAKSLAPTDLTGFWVSVVTEDWRFRMVTPAKGDYPNIPLNAEGRKMADSWDPAKEEGAGNECKAYGAGNVMRVPERLRITWQDDNTLRIATDAGEQTRVFHFGRPQPSAGEPTWQGDSFAQWEFAGETPAAAANGAEGGRRGRGQPRGGDLKVTTTHMRPGYLQKNGVPYSGNTVVTEYFGRMQETNGDSWLIVTSIVEDPQYLTARFVRSTHFKKLPDSSGWRPTPCTAR